MVAKKPFTMNTLDAAEESNLDEERNELITIPNPTRHGSKTALDSRGECLVAAALLLFFFHTL